MRILLDKSYENIQAARELISNHNEYYAASIHCSYYSCYQLIIYLLKYQHGYGNTRQYRAIGSVEGSHEETINLLWRELNDLDNSQNPRTRVATHFDRYMKTLRNMRAKADYKEEVIDSYNSEYVYDDAVKLRQILIDKYQLTSTN